MRSKSSQFLQFLVSTHFNVYVLCETWFKDDILNGEFFTDEYVVYRCDRSILNSVKSNGGGVCIAVHNSIKSSEICCLNKNLEYLAIKLAWRFKTLFIYALYIPPNSKPEVYKWHCDNINFYFHLQMLMISPVFWVILIFLRLIGILMNLLISFYYQ